MAEIQIAWLELMTVGGLGVILVLLGVTFNIIVKRQNKLCTKKTDGIVKQYGFPGNGRMFSMKTSITDRKGGGAYDCERGQGLPL